MQQKQVLKFIWDLSIEYYAASKMIKEVLYKIRFLSNYEKRIETEIGNKRTTRIFTIVRQFWKGKKWCLLFMCVVVCYTCVLFVITQIVIICFYLFIFVLFHSNHAFIACIYMYIGMLSSLCLHYGYMHFNRANNYSLY